jgi:tetratricopeptide (TPR) repeat protein
MVRRNNGRSTWLAMLAVVAALATAVPAFAQSTGMVKGVVTDDKGQPVDGAKISIEMNGGTGRRYESKTNKKGEYIQIGLTGGSYKITAEKDKRGSAPVTVNVRVNQTAQADLVLGIASAAATKEAQEKNAQLKKVFEEGVALSSAGKHNEAIAKFQEAIGVSATCYDCYNNIGYSYAQLKDWEKAEAAYKKSTELKPDDATAHSGLATVYNAERKFDLAAEEGAKATQLSSTLSASGGGGNADAQYNQGVILWNAGKIADAKKAFEAAVAANPQHAEAHYQLGMALVNEGNMAGAATEFETYLKLAPTGPNAATAKSLVDQLKK